MNKILPTTSISPFSHVIALREEIADLFHELVILVVKLHVSPIGSDFFFVEFFLGRFGVFLVVEDNEGRARSLAVEFLYEDA